MIQTVPLPSHELVRQTMQHALEVLRPNFHMGLDLTLAFLPFLLSLVLFGKGRIPSLLWWPMLGVFVLFLPNAPYVLTDVIHFVAKVRVTPPLPIWAMSVLLLEYMVYFLIGMQCFTLSLMCWDRFLRERGRGWLIFPLEFLLIAASAFAIYLGRIDRFNSWDVVTDAGRLIQSTVQDLSRMEPMELTITFFAAVLLIHYLLRLMNTLVIRLLVRRHHSH